MAQTLVSFDELIKGLRKMEVETLNDVLEQMGEIRDSSPFLNGKEPQTESEVWEARWELLEARLQQRLGDEKIVPLLSDVAETVK